MSSSFPLNLNGDVLRDTRIFFTVPEFKSTCLTAEKVSKCADVAIFGPVGRAYAGIMSLNGATTGTAVNVTFEQNDPDSKRSPNFSAVLVMRLGTR
jgi:hypothetical protein